MTRKLITILLLMSVILVAGTIFIRYSNDHMECDNVTETTVGEAGEKITTTRHVCRERFSF